MQKIGTCLQDTKNDRLKRDFLVPQNITICQCLCTYVVLSNDPLSSLTTQSVKSNNLKLRFHCNKPISYTPIIMPDVFMCHKFIRISSLFFDSIVLIVRAFLHHTLYNVLLLSPMHDWLNVCAYIQCPWAGQSQGKISNN